MQLDANDEKHKKATSRKKSADEVKAARHKKSVDEAKTARHKKSAGENGADAHKKSSHEAKTSSHNLHKKNVGAKALPSNRLKLLVTVVDRRKGEFYADLLQSFEVNMQMMCFGRGTANAEMLRYLGLADSEKTVIFSVIREETEADALSALEEKFSAIKNGKGVAFTVPMSGIIGVAIYGFLSNNRSTIKETL